MALKTGEMTGLERIVHALQHKEGDRVPAGPLVCGAARRVLGVTYQDWAQDSDLAVESMIQAQEAHRLDGVLMLVDLSVEGADFGGPMVFPIEDTPHPVYRDNLIKVARRLQEDRVHRPAQGQAHEPHGSAIPTAS